MAHVVSNACTKCGACIPLCPTGAIVESTRQVVIDADSCMDHALCVQVCPVKAISPLKRTSPAGEKHAKLSPERNEDADY